MTFAQNYILSIKFLVFPKLIFLNFSFIIFANTQSSQAITLYILPYSILVLFKLKKTFSYINVI